MRALVGNGRDREVMIRETMTQQWEAAGSFPTAARHTLPLQRQGFTFFSLSSSRQWSRSRKNLSWKRLPSKRGGSSRHRSSPTRGVSRRIPRCRQVILGVHTWEGKPGGHGVGEGGLPVNRQLARAKGTFLKSRDAEQGSGSWHHCRACSRTFSLGCSGRSEGAMWETGTSHNIPPKPTAPNSCPGSHAFIHPTSHAVTDVVVLCARYCASTAISSERQYSWTAFRKPTAG